MIINKTSEIISKVKLSFYFDDKTSKDVDIKTNDIVLIKFRANNDIVTEQGKIISLSMESIEKRVSSFTNYYDNYEGILITLDCSGYYNKKTYSILVDDILDITIVQTTPELKGEPGETQDLSPINESIDALKNSMDDINSSINELKLSIESIKESISNLNNSTQSQINTINSSIDSINDKINTSNTNVSALSETFNSLKSSTDTAISSVNDSLSKIHTDVSSLKIDMATVESDIEALKNKATVE